MNVGSTCISNFRDIRDINGKTAREVNKEWEIQQKRKRLNDIYPGIISKIDTLNKNFDDIPTIVNINTEEKYDKLSSQIQKLYEKFIRSKKINFSIMEEIYRLINESEKIIKNIYIEINKKQGNDWFITKEIKEWCLKDKDNNETVIIFLKEDGIIKLRSACRIYESNFINMVIEKLKKLFNNSDIDIIRFEESDKSIVININKGSQYNSKIDLKCAYRNFMSEFGEGIFEKKRSG